MKTVSVEAPQRLLLGIQGEHLTNAIAFDFAPWQNRYGEGSIQLQVQRCGEDAPYPVPLQVDGNLAVWHIERRDTEKAGYGKLQLLYIVNGEQVAKSCIFATYVETGLSQPGPVPPEEQSFGDKVAQDAAKAEQAAKNAEKAAEQTAQDAAQTAEDRSASEMAKDQAIEAAGTATKDKAAAEGAAKTAVELVTGFDQHAATQKKQLTQLVAQEKQAVSQVGTEERKQLAALGSQVKKSIAQDKADAQAAAEQTKRDANAVSKAAGVVAQQAEATQKNADLVEKAAQEVSAIIDDEVVNPGKTWSSQKISQELSAKADKEEVYELAVEETIGQEVAFYEVDLQKEYRHIVIITECPDKTVSQQETLIIKAGTRTAQERFITYYRDGYGKATKTFFDLSRGFWETRGYQGGFSSISAPVGPTAVQTLSMEKYIPFVNYVKFTPGKNPIPANTKIKIYGAVQ